MLIALVVGAAFVLGVFVGRWGVMAQLRVLRDEVGEMDGKEYMFYHLVGMDLFKRLW